jgi:hypothetical protein
VSGLDHTFFIGQLVECEYRTSPDSYRGNIEHRRECRNANTEYLNAVEMQNDEYKLKINKNGDCE